MISSRNPCPARAPAARHACRARPPGWCGNPASLNPDDKDDAKQQIAGTEQQEGLLTRAQAIGDAEQRDRWPPQVEQGK